MPRPSSDGDDDDRKKRKATRATRPGSGSLPPTPVPPGGIPPGGVLTQGYHPGHYGVDIAMPVNTPIYAPRGLMVTHAGWSDVGYGLSIFGKDPKTGVKYIFGHLNSLIEFTPGQYIPAGTLLGYEGSTGNSTGPHLHLELKGPEGQRIVPTPQDVFYSFSRWFTGAPSVPQSSNLLTAGPAPAPIMIQAAPGSRPSAPVPATTRSESSPGTIPPASGSMPGFSGVVARPGAVSAKVPALTGLPGPLSANPAQTAKNITYIAIGVAILFAGLILFYMAMTKKESGPDLKSAGERAIDSIPLARQQLEIANKIT